MAISHSFFQPECIHGIFTLHNTVDAPQCCAVHTVCRVNSSTFMELTDRKMDKSHCLANFSSRMCACMGKEREVAGTVWKGSYMSFRTSSSVAMKLPAKGTPSDIDVQENHSWYSCQHGFYITMHVDILCTMSQYSYVHWTDLSHYTATSILKEQS